MPAVLTTGDTLTCIPGNGTVQSKGAAKLLVGSQPVLTQDGVIAQSVSKCAPPGSPPPPPCTIVLTIESGVAKKLLVANSPVLLDALKATGGPAGHKIGPASAGQSKLVAS